MDIDAVNLHVKAAYKKLKSFIYYDNTQLFLKVELAQWEAEGDIDIKLDNLSNSIHDWLYDRNIKSFELLLGKIDVIAIPKGVVSPEEKSEPTAEDEPMIFSNSTSQSKFYIEKTAYFIKAPVEVHVISMLWVMLCGSEVDRKLKSNCRGNRLILGQDGIGNLESLASFLPYYKQYQHWRDDAIEAARRLHNEKKACILLTLDVRSFYDSVDFDLNGLSFNSAYLTEINRLLNLIHNHYASIRLDVNSKILPIGLVSSAVLANHCLAEFDEKIVKSRPSYYGRYVDDIFLVFSPENVSNIKPKTLIAEVLKFNNEVIKRSGEKFIELESKYGKFVVQNKKVRCMVFNPSSDMSILDKFTSEIKKTSSEFQRLLEDTDILNNFESESTRISYSDSPQKLRSIKEFGVDKLNAAIQLRNLLEMSLRSSVGRRDSKKINLQIRRFFTGRRFVEYYTLWDRAIAYFLANNEQKNLSDFIISLKRQIRKMTTEEGANSDALNFLENYIEHSLSLTAAVDLGFIAKLRKYDVAKYLNLDSILKNARNVRKANIFKHSLCAFPLLNYCLQDDDTALNRTTFKTFASFDIESVKLHYSPRHIKKQETDIFLFFSHIFGRKKKDQKSYEKSTRKNLGKLYHRPISSAGFYSHHEKANGHAVVAPKNLPFKSINLFKVGVGNVEVAAEDAFRSIVGSPNLSDQRRMELNKLINQAVIEKVDGVVFPEVFLPWPWITDFADIARRTQKLIVSGLEHIACPTGKVFNYSVIYLPFESNGIKDCNVYFLRKRYLAANEKEAIRQAQRIPAADRPNTELRIFKWHGVHFSVFNCLELSNIKLRSLTTGNVDCIFAIENNKDTHYYSNVVESLCRDSHAFIVQVNNSFFGDSRLTQPTSSVTMDLVKIKGGKNKTLIVGELDISSLRHFHFAGTTGLVVGKAKSEVEYKPLPPGFSPNTSRRPENISQIDDKE